MNDRKFIQDLVSSGNIWRKLERYNPRYTKLCLIESIEKEVCEEECELPAVF